MTLKLRTAACLDRMPSLFRGLNAVEIAVSTLLSSVAWLLPCGIVSAMLFDRFQAFTIFLMLLTVCTVITSFVTATIIRSLRRDRPFNWINRQIVSRVEWTEVDLIRPQSAWNR